MDYPILDVKEQVLEDNDRIAAQTREALRRSGTLLINLMGSPGAGKTSVLLQILRRLGSDYRIGVMEADVDSDVDARTVAAAGAKVVQLHTGGLCHMDAAMTAQGLKALGVLPAQNLPCLQDPTVRGTVGSFIASTTAMPAQLASFSKGTGLEAGGGVRSDLDLVFLENVGNLVCPAEFDVGADLRVMILSVPEGDDKPLKYPLMFTVSDLMLVNKLDTAPIFDFDLDAAASRARALNPKMEIFPISAKTGEGFDALTDWLRRRLHRRPVGAELFSRPVGADAHIGPPFPEGGAVE